MRGNPDNLRKATAAKSAAAQQRAEQALTRMLQDGQQITFRGLAQTARVSLDFLYHHHDIRQRVEQLRTQQPPTPQTSPTRTDPDQPSSVIRTLTTQLTELKHRHREEVTTLRQALEAAHGENLQLRRRLPADPTTTSPAHD